MYDHCGCLDLDAIAELTAEHDVVVTLSGQVRRALLDGDLDLAAMGARAIVAILQLHTAVEAGAPQIDQVLPESAYCTPGDPFWPRRLEQALVEESRARNFLVRR